MREQLWHFRDRFPLAAIAVEVFAVVLAVLLALTLDQWREQRNNRQLAEAALITIRREVQSNQCILEDRFPYHVTARDSMQSFAGSLTEDITFNEVRFARLGFPRGGRFFDLSAAAYRTALSSGALAHVDYDLLSVLGAVYEEQESLDANDAIFTGTVFNPQNFAPGALYYMLFLAPGLMNDVIDAEAQLHDLYEQFLEQTASLNTGRLTPIECAQAETVDSVQP